MPTFVKNKKAHFNYEILEKMEAGLKLLGFEAKSLRKNQGSLEGAYIIVRGGEAFLIGAHIPPFQPANTPDSYDPYRNRKLLLTKKELAKLADIDSKKGLTITPISVYSKGHNLKLEIGIGRGKKKYDKREDIKKRDSARDVAREIRDK